MPLMLSFLMALFDFGFAELKTSQLSSAARDGARKAIVNHSTAAGSVANNAACPNTPAGFAAACAAVRLRLAGTKVKAITVECRNDLGSTVIACTSVQRGTDSV